MIIINAILFYLKKKLSLSIAFNILFSVHP